MTCCRCCDTNRLDKDEGPHRVVRVIIAVAVAVAVVVVVVVFVVVVVVVVVVNDDDDDADDADPCCVSSSCLHVADHVVDPDHVDIVP